MPLSEVPEPWNSLLRELDAEINEDVRLCCVGGFAITIQYGLPRPTSDVDVLSIMPPDQIEAVQAAAGQGSRLHSRHGIYVHSLLSGR